MNKPILDINMVMELASQVADYREKLCRKKPQCIQCQTRQVQIIDAYDQEWKCRECKAVFFTNYEIKQ